MAPELYMEDGNVVIVRTKEEKGDLGEPTREEVLEEAALALGQPGNIAAVIRALEEGKRIKWTIQGEGDQPSQPFLPPQSLS